ncbi:MAG: NAD(P)H-hydrate dehydratase [Candidatus Zixiibacteriota bacterium]
MKLVTSEQMRAIDREAIEKRGIPGNVLMENAGRAIAAHLSDIVSSGDCVTIFCGKGNNGGDGFVIGRYLANAGVDVSMYFLGPSDELSADAKLNHSKAIEAGLNVSEMISTDVFPQELGASLIVDALFGTGFSGSPRGISAELIQLINRQDVRVAAVDIPSGLNADNGQHYGEAVQASHTYTLSQPKYGLYLSPGRELAGQVEVVPIGIPDDLVESFKLTTELITPELVTDILPIRKRDGHKGQFGKLLVLAGSTGMAGAAVLAARGAYRSGAGLVRIACPRTVLPTIAPSVIEATTHPLPDVAKKGALALRGLGEVRKLLPQHDAVVIGPGLGQHRETSELVRRLVGGLDRPSIIDADGLNALVNHLDLLKQTNVPTVLTPHVGEFERMIGESLSESIHERIESAAQFATTYGVVLVLKGSPTVVASTEGSSFINPTGNDGMATGGSGDVLSGIIGTFLSQGLSAPDAAVCGVYIHGLAGDLAAEELTARAMMAGDIAEFLPGAFESLEST